MKDARNIPAIRFKEFSEAWEQHRLREVVQEVTRVEPTSNAPVMMITANNGFIEQSERYSTNNAGKSLTKYILLKKGELAYNHGASKLRPYGSCFALTEEREARIPFVYHCFSSVGQNSEFLSFILNSVTVENQLRKIVSSGARMDGLLNISFDDYSSVSIQLPSRNEQNRITELLNHISALITLHQRKIDALKTLKKALLAEMFPDNGSDKPLLRFKGFNDAWEQRRLGEIFEEYSEKDHEELPALTIIQGGGTVRRDESDRNLQYDKSSLSNYKMVREGDFIVHLRSFEGGLEVATTTGIISPAYHTLHGDNADPRFYYSYFRSKEFINQKLVQHVYGIRDGRSIDIQGMKTIEIPWTSYNEQKVIGDCIDGIDTLITLHQRKLEGLKTMKTFLLQNMFI